MAPNSPSETANENPAPTASARAAIGRSISRRTLAGAAPKVAAASRRRTSMPRRVGTTTRITNGTPIRAWATGTSHRDDRKSSGGSLNAMSMPKPTVTAEAPSGSIIPRSKARAKVRRPCTTTTEASPPTTTARPAATTANTSELRNAPSAETGSRESRSARAP